MKARVSREPATDLPNEEHGMSLRFIPSLFLLLSLCACVNAVDQDGDGSAGCPRVLGFPIGGSVNCEPDDRNSRVFPGAPEICDGLDNDLDEATDEGFDADGDGHFDGTDSGCALAYNGEADCDDEDSANYPGNTELCDGADNDCDSLTHAGEGESDADADGVRACAGDCDDDRYETYPGAPEICDGWDNDCDGWTPEIEFDGDSDGEPACEDCDDLDPANFHGNEEVCDGLDNDCDGDADAEDAETDADADGYSACAGDCNDEDTLVYPGRTEVCNSVDDDCDALTDEGFDQDGDFFTSCAGDCNDANPAFNPSANEICDGADNDCDGSADFDLELETDQDGDGIISCADCDDADSANFPGNPEVCDGADNDCDGVLSLEETDDDLDGVTECEGDCDDADAQNFPGNEEVCDGADNDCDGILQIDEYDDDLDSWMICDGDCDDENQDYNPGEVEFCADWQDNDCDGLVDYEDPTPCTNSCGTPVMLAPSAISDGSFEGSVMNWFQIPNGSGYDDDVDPALGTTYAVEGAQSLELVNPTRSTLAENPPAVRDLQEQIGVEFLAAPGSFIVTFAGVGDNASSNTFWTHVSVVDSSNYETEFCGQDIFVLDEAFGWSARFLCCTLGSVAGSYTLIISHGSQEPGSILLFDAVEVYPIL